MNKEVQRPLVEMLEAYDGRDVKHINLSGNGWNELQVRPLLRAIACERKISRFCNLAAIDLSGNRLDAIPSTLMDEDNAFPSLSSIDAGTNQVKEISSVIIRRMIGSDGFAANLETNPVIWPALI